MILETANEQYKNQTGAEFKRFYWWEAVRHQPKWRARSNVPSTIDAFVMHLSPQVRLQLRRR
jgi:hypothetical protein